MINSAKFLEVDATIKDLIRRGRRISNLCSRAIETDPNNPFPVWFMSQYYQFAYRKPMAIS